MGVAARDDDARSARHEQEVSDLTTQISFLEEEVAVLRRRLSDSPRQVRVLEERLRDTQVNLAAVTSQNERLAATLREARDQIVALKEEVDRLAQPPSGFGTFLEARDDGTVDVFTGGRKMRVNVSPSVEVSELRPGQEVVLNEALNVVLAQRYETVGEVVMLKETLDDGERALVIAHADEERVVRLAEPLRDAPLRAGDSLLLEPRAGYVYERIPKAEVEELILEEVPDITYADIGGLGPQIEQIRDAIELPYLHADLFKEHMLRPPKGVLLYGPPGCGKTLIAKAVANSLAKQVAAKVGGDYKSFFLNIKGPELLNKYVGETERHIRLVFQRAREKASEGMANVIVIGASNREDMIDPAILRPGRLDVKIKIERPDAEAARDIFSKYVVTGLPLHPDDMAEHGGSNDETEENRFLEVTYANGDKDVLYFRDFNSGAMIQNIADRAKKQAIKEFLETGQKGLRVAHLLTACVEEFSENEDLPNTTNPDDWARISGKKGERIVYIRTLISGKQGTEAGRSIDTVANTGQYL